MSSLTGDLLNSIGDETAMRTILEDNRDFLLEPLEEEDALAVRSMDTVLYYVWQFNNCSTPTKAII